MKQNDIRRVDQGSNQQHELRQRGCHAILAWGLCLIHRPAYRRPALDLFRGSPLWGTIHMDASTFKEHHLALFRLNTRTIATGVF